MNKALNVTESAKLLGVSAPTVYVLMRSRKLPAVKVGRQWRVREEALAEFLRGGGGNGGETGNEPPRAAQ
jgi:excisionase family DNA binding protein